MSSSALMSIGLTAMTANYASMQTTGHNIANAQTPGYSRQTVDLTTAGGQYSGSGFYGKGVDVVSVQRANDQFLTAQSASASSMAAMDDARRTNLQQLQNAFPEGDTGMGAAMGTFLNAYVDLANTPSDSSARQVILNDAGSVAYRFADAGGQLQTLQTGVTSDLKTGVAEVNQMAAQIAKINGQIAGLQGSGQPPNDLLDQRDELVKKLGDYVKVSTISASDGTVGVFIAGGQRLVLGTEAESLEVTADPADSSRSSISMDDGGTLRQLSPDLLVGGSLSGLLSYQNGDLVDARNQLGQMAAAFSARVNAVQAYGLDMTTAAGSSGAAIFSVGDPSAIANANNSRNTDGSFVSTATLTVTDATQLRASDYSLAADPSNSGDFIVTRKSDGVEFGMVADSSSTSGYTYTRLSDDAALGDSMDGFEITFSGTPATTDTFELHPVGDAAAGMERVLSDPAGIAAASPMTATMGVDNTGTASVASLNVVSSSNVPGTSTAITFTSSTGAYSYTLTDSSGGTTTGTGTWTAGSPISLNGYELYLNGVPASGDTIAVVKTAHPATNNGNALAMVALRDDTFVGRVAQLDGTLAYGETPTDAYASALADVGVRVQSAQTASTISQSAADQAQAAVAQKSGVNLDEEAGRLIQFQQGYQAAAKVLQVAQSIFDTMLQLASH